MVGVLAGAGTLPGAFACCGADGPTRSTLTPSSAEESSLSGGSEMIAASTIARWMLKEMSAPRRMPLSTYLILLIAQSDMARNRIAGRFDRAMQSLVPKRLEH